MDGWVLAEYWTLRGEEASHWNFPCSNELVTAAVYDHILRDSILSFWFVECVVHINVIVKHMLQFESISPCIDLNYLPWLGAWQRSFAPHWISCVLSAPQTYMDFILHPFIFILSLFCGLCGWMRIEDVGGKRHLLVASLCSILFVLGYGHLSLELCIKSLFLKKNLTCIFAFSWISFLLIYLLHNLFSPDKFLLNDLSYLFNGRIFLCC